MDDVKERLDAIFNSDTYKKVAEAIKTEYMLSTALLDEQGELREKDWTPVKELVLILGKPWKLFVFKYATATETLGKPVVITFVRAEPPDTMKLALGTLPKEDTGWQHAVEEYGAAAASEDMTKVKSNLMQLFEFKIYPGKNFGFVPDPQTYGLLPHFDFDLMIPFIGLTSLIQNSQK